MPTVHFLGKIIPSNHYKTTMRDLPGVKYRSQESDLECEATPEIQDSEIDVRCIVNRFDSDVREQVHKLAYDVARATVNFVCFSTGLHLSVNFDEFIGPDGQRSAFIIHHPNLAALCTSYSLGAVGPATDLGTVMQYVLSDPRVFLALDDLITATGHHHLLTVNSARAIEGLRHAMGGSIADRNKQWELFRTNLNLSKNYLALITDSSTSGRHGEGKFIPGEVTEKIIDRSWIIMNRFFEFKKRKDQPLPLSEFPLLSA
jgi:hypothetical protein